MCLGYVLSILHSYMKCESQGGHPHRVCNNLSFFQALSEQTQEMFFHDQNKLSPGKMQYFQLTLLLASAKCI